MLFKGYGAKREAKISSKNVRLSSHKREMSCQTRSQHFIFNYYIILFTATWTTSLPIVKIQRPATPFDVQEIDGKLEKYLTKFGYLPPSDSGIGSFRTEQHLRNAVKSLQAFAGLNATGYIDSKTADLLRKPRCGVPDLNQDQIQFNNLAINDRTQRGRNKRYILHGGKWEKVNLTWSLKALPHMPAVSKDFERGAIRQQIYMALDLWARPSKLTFLEVSENDMSADIQVYFGRGFHGDGYPFDGPGFVLAHAFFPGSGRGGDVHFDADEKWTDGKHSKVDYDTSVANLFAVAAHEFGHSLGLSHSPETKSLMFPWYSFKMPVHFKLPKDDLDGIVLLYGKSSDYDSDVVSEEDSDLKNETDDSDSSGEEYGQEAEEPIVPERNSTSEDSIPPNRCVATFDAVSIIRNEMWAFKKKYFWRILETGQKTEVNDPVTLSAFWYALPVEKIDHIDAVYERHDHRIVFFIGKFMYILNGNVNLDSHPVPLTQIGLPESLEKVDAVFRWGWNGKTYIFSGKSYWRFDEGIQHVELDYPRNISTWNGVPDDIDSAFQHTNGNTYFFKGQDFWEFDNQLFKVKNSVPKNIGYYWMQCPNQIEDSLRHSLAQASNARQNESGFTFFTAIPLILCYTKLMDNDHL